jgi:hypothetical protein
VSIAATVERDTLVATVIALFHMTTERRGTTTLDCAHDTPLSTTQRVAMYAAVIWASVAKNIRQFKPAGTHGAPQK